MTKGKYARVFPDEARQAVMAYPNVDSVWPNLNQMGFVYFENGDDYSQQLSKKFYTVRLDWKPIFDPPRWEFTVTKTDTEPKNTTPFARTFIIGWDETEKCIRKLLGYIHDLIEE